MCCVTTLNRLLLEFCTLLSSTLKLFWIQFLDIDSFSCSLLESSVPGVSDTVKSHLQPRVSKLKKHDSKGVQIVLKLLANWHRRRIWSCLIPTLPSPSALTLSHGENWVGCRYDSANTTDFSKCSSQCRKVTTSFKSSCSKVTIKLYPSC